MRKNKYRKKRLHVLIIILFLFICSYLILNLERKDLNGKLWSTLEGNTIETSDGNIYFNFSKENTGPLVVLVHGFSTPSYIWDPTYDFLENNGYRVISYDLFGRGYLDRPNADYNLDLYVRQLSELLSELGIND